MHKVKYTSIKLKDTGTRLTISNDRGKIQFKFLTLHKNKEYYQNTLINIQIFI